MDTEKLLRILNDIAKDDSELGLTQKIEELRGLIAQNTPESFTTAQKQLSVLTKTIQDTSVSYTFSRTEEMLLRSVGGSIFFGKGLVTELTRLFAMRGFEILSQVDTFRTNRNEFIQRSQRLVTALNDMGVKEYRPAEYEVGIVLPEAEGNLDKLPKILSQLDRLLSVVAEATGSNRNEVSITRMGNGSIELFSLQPEAAAEMLSTLYLNVSKIWEKIAKRRKDAESIAKDSDLSDGARESIRKILEDETAKIKDEILETLPDLVMKAVDGKIEQTHKNEIRNEIRASLKAVFGWFEVGIEVDITPVRVPQAKEAASKSASAVALIKDANSHLAKVYALPPEMKKLPFRLSEEEIESESDTVPTDTIDIPLKPTGNEQSPEKQESVNPTPKTKEGDVV